jgi:glycosyltransferase involved in cell wall biosynthesis
VVHAHKLYPQLSVAAVVVASHRGVPVVQTVHDYEFVSASALDDTGDWRDRREERRNYRFLNTALFGVKRVIHRPRINRWISVSRSTDHSYRAHGIETTVLPNFTETNVHPPSSFDNREGILFMGRLAEEKGLRDVLELPKYIPNVPIMIAGDGPLADEVHDAVRNFPSITYVGKLDRGIVAQRLTEARVVVMPSLWREPGPLTALEAMAAGTPIVAYDNGGLAEYVKDAAGGVVVSPNPRDLAEATSALYSDNEHWLQCSSNGRAAILRDHTLAVYLDRLEDVYGEAIKARRHDET